MRIKGLPMIKRILGVLLLAGVMSGTAAFAQTPGNPAIVATDASGTLRYRVGDGDSQPLAKGQAIPIGARLATGVDSHVVLTFPDGQIVALGPQSRLLMREFVYLPTDLGKSRVLLNLTDGAIFIVMGAIGQRDPGLVQIQVGAKIAPQSPRRARGSDTGVIVLGTATLVQVAQGRVSLFVAASNQSLALASGARALVQADGNVRTGTPPQVDGEAGRSVDGKIMLGRMEVLRRYLPPAGRPIALFVTTPPADDLVDDLAAPGEIPVTGTVPTAATGGVGGGPCGASCN